MFATSIRPVVVTPYRRQGFLFVPEDFSPSREERERERRGASALVPDAVETIGPLSAPAFPSYPRESAAPRFQPSRALFAPFSRRSHSYEYSRHYLQIARPRAAPVLIYPVLFLSLLFSSCFSLALKRGRARSRSLEIYFYVVSLTPCAAPFSFVQRRRRDDDDDDTVE